MTLRELEERGYTVRFSHKRITDKDLVAARKYNDRLKDAPPEALKARFELREAKLPIASSGGYTKAEIYNEEEVLIATGETWCNPNDPSFNKKLGREIALGRAMKMMNQSEVLAK